MRPERIDLRRDQRPLAAAFALLAALPVGWVLLAPGEPGPAPVAGRVEAPITSEAAVDVSPADTAAEGRTRVRPPEPPPAAALDGTRRSAAGPDVPDEAAPAIGGTAIAIGAPTPPPSPPPSPTRSAPPTDRFERAVERRVAYLLEQKAAESRYEKTRRALGIHEGHAADRGLRELTGVDTGLFDLDRSGGRWPR